MTRPKYTQRTIKTPHWEDDHDMSTTMWMFRLTARRLASVFLVSTWLTLVWNTVWNQTLQYDNHNNAPSFIPSEWKVSSNSRPPNNDNAFNGSNTTTNDDPLETCLIPPGYANEEASLMGYQVLRRMQYYLQQQNHHVRLQLLCVLPTEIPIEYTTTMLETYGADCDTIVIVTSDQATAAKLSSLPNNKNLRLHNFSTYRQLFQSLGEIPHTWLYWAHSDRYLVYGNLKTLTNNIHRHQSPHVLEEWILDDPSHGNYHGLYGRQQSGGGCNAPSVWNRATTKLLAKCLESSSENTQDWLAICLQQQKAITCARPVVPHFQQSPWLYLQRYYEIQLPTISQTNSLHRYHTILHGWCDAYWDRPLGALDEQHQPNYIHDPYYLRHHPLSFNRTFVCQTPPGHGDEGVDGLKGLQKIHITTNNSRKRILCMVYTHSQRHDRLRAIAETWGTHCDGFLAASNQTNVSIGAVNLLKEGPESYSNMWGKVTAMWKYAYQHYLDHFDYFHIGGDDHYVIVENLRHILSVGSWKGPWNESQALYLGGSLALGKKRRYCNGGSGYTLNRVALQLLVQDLLWTPRCWPHWQSSDEDRIIASCFRSVGIQCMDTNDERNETRYHTWHADQHAAWHPGLPAQDWELLPENHGIAWKEGLGQISETSVSFHLKNKESLSADSGMRRYHAILYGMCNFTK